MGLFIADKAAKWAYQNAYVKAPAGTPANGYRPKNDCTNFVSCALWVGGWQMVVPNNNHTQADRTNLNYWYIDNGINDTLSWSTHYISHTWTSAPDFAIFATQRAKRGTVIHNGVGLPLNLALNLQPGDVMQTRDETGSDDKTGAENVTHTAILVEAASPGIVHRNEKAFPVDAYEDGPPKNSGGFGLIAQHQNDSLRPLTRWVVNFKKQAMFIWRPHRVYLDNVSDAVPIA
jgi:hypothetical protein